jgi:hypothetical protein
MKYLYTFLVLLLLLLLSSTNILLSQDCFVDQDGLKQGKCAEEYGATFIIRESNYKNGELDGAYVIRYKYTNRPYIIEKGSYVLGKKHGLEYRYDTKGRLLTVINYANGIFNGMVVRYVKGRLSIIERYENGIADGLWQTFNKDGTPKFYFYCSAGIFGDVHYLNRKGGVEKIVPRKKKPLK